MAMDTIDSSTCMFVHKYSFMLKQCVLMLTLYMIFNPFDASSTTLFAHVSPSDNGDFTPWLSMLLSTSFLSTLNKLSMPYYQYAILLFYPRIFLPALP